eukprot:CAMPEP_0180821320 /NCGR_PEP_ID=MMETSP1038_2-20121128/70767_1 /TAXON_ID=632150 /ORGANISM="Azadinium spinosum, Strain 3D9" /LENGTH=55 /DNA_ID=CAMNT_0022863493 /DNA_START=56 /DNA_END=220 /DNA_ORIENTATION=+
MSACRTKLTPLHAEATGVSGLGRSTPVLLSGAAQRPTQLPSDAALRGNTGLDSRT